VGTWALAGALWGAQTPDRSAQPDKPPGAEAAPTRIVPVGKNVHLEVQGERRRVFIDAHVCLREGSLEFFLCRRHTKEHESILAAAMDAKDVHTALCLARAKEGRPAQWLGKLFVAPSGDVVKVALEYEVKKKTIRVPAQQWVRFINGKKDLNQDWVFAGSRVHLDPTDPGRVFYGANDGAVISVSNFEESLLDLPFESSANGDNLLFEAHTERIPAVGTAVRVILEPVMVKKK
jgi:hypothetical protein